MPPLSQEDFAFLARLLRRRSGLSLTPAKRDLVERRLAPVMRRFGFRDAAGLVHELRLGQESLARAVTEAVTVHDTAFFRDAGAFLHFEKELLPAMLRARAQTKRLRIWSAACATGQETWSIAIILDRLALAAQGWSIDLIATDLSAEAIARAEEGRYDGVEMERGLEPARRANFFRPSGEHWRIADHLRRMAHFRVFNLLDSYGWLDDIDFIFCRNVLMYFDRAAKASVLERMADTMAADGCLLLGAAETIEPLSTVFVEAPGGTGVYAKSGVSAVRELGQRLSA
jgi:chemotaxis protein methyltransferase CheR